MLLKVAIGERKEVAQRKKNTSKREEKQKKLRRRLVGRPSQQITSLTAIQSRDYHVHRAISLL